LFYIRIEIRSLSVSQIVSVFGLPVCNIALYSSSGKNCHRSEENDGQYGTNYSSEFL